MKNISFYFSFFFVFPPDKNDFLNFRLYIAPDEGFYKVREIDYDFLLNPTLSYK